MIRFRHLCCLALLLLWSHVPLATATASAATAPSSSSKTPAASKTPAPVPPHAPKRTVIDTYWGVKVPDDYRYMENVKDPAVATWAKGQNAATRAWLDGHPERKALLERLIALRHSDSPDYYGGIYAGGRYFFLKEQPPKQQPYLVYLTNVDELATERPVLDPNVIDAGGGTAIDFYTPSLDGKLVAVSLSKGGTEDGTLYFYDTESGRRLEDTIPRVNGGTAGGSAVWKGDGTGVYYTRYPHEGERPSADLPFYQQIYFHKVGTPVSADTYVLGKEFPKIAEIALSSSADGQSILADVSNGDGGEHSHWLLSNPGGSWVQVTRFEDGVVQARIGGDGAIYMLSRAGAPHKRVLKIPVNAPRLSEAKVVVPETDNAIESITPAATRLYVREIVGGPTQVRVYDMDGKQTGLIAMPEVAIVGQAERTTGDDVLIRSQSYTRPPAQFRYRSETGKLEATALAQTSPADFSDCEVTRVFATAEDGTKIPINLLMKKGTPLNGRAPVLLYGYGSYGLIEQPSFRPALKAWIEQGGIYADASVRGGGEFGDAWHDAARLGTKQVSMDDFAACARFLVSERYTSKERLAIYGGSAGGLLVYGTVVHHPGDMQAAVAAVGYGDVLRTEVSPNGEFNTTEFGTVKDSLQFQGMYRYSPYHHVKKGVTYPSVLALTGMNDPRVEPWETFKMVARLQASGSPNRVLMRVSLDSGHGVQSSLSERDQETADTYLFLFDRLGVKYRPVAPPKPGTKSVPSMG